MLRPLLNNTLVTNFLEGLFGEQNPITQSAIVDDIYITERALRPRKGETLSTLEHDEFRSHPYKTNQARWRLRNKIVQELFSQKRLPNDENIKLGKGGTLPHKPCQYNRQAYLITGLPASGKSGIAATIADSMGAAIIDSDYVKRKLPEYRRLSIGASVIHAESGALVLGNPHLNGTDFKTLLDLFSEKGTNIVLPKIGDTVESVLKLVRQLGLYEYDVHLTSVNLDRQKATKRAVHRFKDTKRYVPLSLIYDVYANEPILTYYRLKELHQIAFKSIGKISTDVEKGQPYQFMESEGDDNPALLFR